MYRIFIEFLKIELFATALICIILCLFKKCKLQVNGLSPSCTLWETHISREWDNFCNHKMVSRSSRAALVASVAALSAASSYCCSLTFARYGKWACPSFHTAISDGDYATGPLCVMYIILHARAILEVQP